MSSSSWWIAWPVWNLRKYTTEMPVALARLWHFGYDYFKPRYVCWTPPVCYGLIWWRHIKVCVCVFLCVSGICWVCVGYVSQHLQNIKQNVLSPVVWNCNQHTNTNTCSWCEHNLQQHNKQYCLFESHFPVMDWWSSYRMYFQRHNGPPWLAILMFYWYTLNDKQHFKKNK